MSVDIDQLVFEIAARFAEHGMAKHLEHLRAYYRDRQRRRRARARDKQPPWTEDLVLTWAALWRIPPFEGVYPVLARGSLCPCSSNAQGDGGDPGAVRRHDARSFIEMTFPEGHLTCCGACRTRWLVLGV